MATNKKQQWVIADVAEYLGVARPTVEAYRARGQMPEADGAIGRTPWWWSTTITKWREPARRGPGGREAV